MTDEEVMRELRVDSPLNRARMAFSAACAQIEQTEAQWKQPGPIEMRRMEFEAVRKIAKALGVEL